MKLAYNSGIQHIDSIVHFLKFGINYTTLFCTSFKVADSKTATLEQDEGGGGGEVDGKWFVCSIIPAVLSSVA